MCGDFNAHIGNRVDQGGIANNPHPNVNHNGQRLLFITEEFNLRNMFALFPISEGAGTYYSGERTSVIDYIMWSGGLRVIDGHCTNKGGVFDLLSHHVPLIARIQSTGTYRPRIANRRRSRSPNWDALKTNLGSFFENNLHLPFPSSLVS